MLTNIIYVYALGCLAAVIPVTLLIINNTQKKIYVPFIFYFFDVLFSWLFLILFLIENIKQIEKTREEITQKCTLEDKIKSLKENPSRIEPTDDCDGFLNFTVKASVEAKNIDGKIVTVLDLPLVMILNQYLKDYGYKTDSYKITDMRIGIQLPTGAKAYFPYATKTDER